MKNVTLKELTLSILSILVIFRSVYSFSVSPSVYHKTQSTHRLGSNQVFRQKNVKFNMIGDFVSGITGQAPKQLDVPFDELLSGTNIDPSRDNVDLKCVYKASKDGWTALDFHSNCDGRGE